MAFKYSICFASLVALVTSVHIDPPPRVAVGPEEFTTEFWHDLAQEELKEALNLQPNTNVAKNVIIFLGDGMSLTTVTAGRIYKGQMNGKTGENEKLSFEKFPYLGLSKTYSRDAQISDSAVTATAVFCGTKSVYATVGVGPATNRGNCSDSIIHAQTCIAEKAQLAGKDAGFVTTARVSHATPGNIYAHSADRGWENDVLTPQEVKDAGCIDIPAQLMNEPGVNFKVVLGGGRANMMPNTEADPEYPDKTGSRGDGRNIANEWVAEKEGRGTAKYVWNQADFDAVDPAETDYLMGLFEQQHVKYEVDRKDDPAGEPPLADMVEKAIKLLNKNEKGFFLQVEGARIDHGSHENRAYKSMGDMVSFDAAIQRAYDLTDPADTLIVVTADHAHVLTMTSYARRGNYILGLTDYSTDKSKNGLSDADGLPWTTLAYSNGPGFTPREDLTDVDVYDSEYQQRSLIPLKSASHDGTDVGIFATGPMSHLWHNVHEEHYTFHAASYAACLDDEKAHCKKKR